MEKNTQISNIYYITVPSYKVPPQALREHQLACNKFPHIKEKLDQVIVNCTEILNKFCDVYDFSKKDITTLLEGIIISVSILNPKNTREENKVAAGTIINSEYRFACIDLNFVNRNNVSEIGKMIIHELLHLSSQSVQKESKTKKLRMRQLGTEYLKVEDNEYKFMGTYLNEALVEAIANIIAFKNEEKYLESIDYSGYEDLIKPILNLMQILEKNEKGLAKEFFDLMVKTLKEGKPYLIMRFLNEKTGIILKPKEILTADFSIILDKQKELNKNEIPYFGNEFWQKSPEKK